MTEKSESRVTKTNRSMEGFSRYSFSKALRLMIRSALFFFPEMWGASRMSK